MSHSPNPHTNLLNVFIQIANNKGIFKKKMMMVIITTQYKDASMFPCMIADYNVVKPSQYSGSYEFADEMWGNVFEEDRVISRHHMSSNCGSSRP
jgi:hypothetical protein